MPYGNYSYVINSSFNPFTLQEMLMPFSAYKDAFEKTEDAYIELADKSDKFKYLSSTLPEGSKARQIYEGYANNLSAQAEDLARNGLTMANRSALTSLKRRYQGEIGRLSQADEAMKKEKELRRQMGLRDTSMLYATDSLNIDDFLDENTPNLYSISGNELYTRGAAAGKAASSRVINIGDKGSTLGGYYRDWVEQYGYSPESINAFRKDASAIPELQAAADAILKERGVLQNLEGANLERARESVINGMIDGAVFTEKHNPTRDLGVLSKEEEKRINIAERGQALAEKRFDLETAVSGYEKVGDKWVFNPNKALDLQKAAAIAAIKQSGSGGSSKGSGTAYDVRNKETIMIGAKSGKLYKHSDDEGPGIGLDDISPQSLSSQDYTSMVSGETVSNEYIRSAIGNGKLSDYEIYKIPAGSTEISGTGWFDNDDLDEDVYIIKPRESKRSATDTLGGVSTDSFSDGSNDIPK